ncbi:MAG: hypothetical protein A2148_02725 [Chloroflexi bacterium RBG_16_68_14]|nr:MAG: hypothetical protein A2148_02725 [Chloroflexi bacterium RBG_16_68_14]
MHRWLVLLALVGLGLLVGPAHVSAHADYERSEPARGAVLLEPPARVDVWFTQDVFKKQGANFVRVFDEQDVQVSQGDGEVDDNDRTHVSATLPPGLPDGRYIVRWMTTSDEDGDTDEGAFCFYLRVEPSAGQAAECAALAGPEGEASPTAAAATPTEPAATTPTEAGAAPTPTTGPAEGEDGDGGIPTAAVVGGAVAGAVVLVIVVGAVALWLRRTLA